MIIQIDIKDILAPTLDRIASMNGLASDIYARNIVESFLESQYRGEVIDKFKTARIEDLKILKDNKLADLTKKVK